ncbi:MAG: GH1 family beta-glucosidase [Pseudomonadota bacterium]
MKTLNFPPDFFWGTATSSYQIEGGAKDDGRSPSIWDVFAETEGRVRNGDTGAVACDSYHRIDEDVALLKQLGVNMYRFSISWSRVIPEGRGAVNAAGLDYYVRLVKALRAANIEPMITLYHWDLPQCLMAQGGWESRQTSLDFVAFAKVMFEALKGDVKYWLTINEPWCASLLSYLLGIHAPGRQDMQAALSVGHHLLLGHGLAVQAFRDMGMSGQIGIAPNVGWREPYSEHPADIDAARRSREWVDGWFMDPLYLGSYPADMAARFNAWGAAAPIQPGDMEIIAAPTDYLGINYYFGGYAKARDSAAVLGVPGTGPEMVNALIDADEIDVPGFSRTDFDWAIYPEGFDKILRYIRDRYNNPPLFVTENGACDNTDISADGRIDDDMRVKYYRHHLIAMHRAIRSGCNVKGYMAWSLLDNFEWAEGYSKRFGLVHVDFDTLVRTPKESFNFYRQVIANNQIALPE